MANFDVELNDEVENFTVEFDEIQRITVDDFDKLRNRPSYAGQTMTHETNIPEVPTAVSQLTNDADYQTGSEVESAISTAVGDEKDAREQADDGLSRDIGVVDGKVDAEADARERADITLQGAIDDEETARKNADNGLQGQIDAITSSSDVVDIMGTYAELLQYPTAGLGDKDVIKVLQDETHNDAMSYYRWNKNSSTWSYIGSEGPYYTKSETNTLLGDKQDTLTAGSNVTISSNNTISATDTTYTAGNGLTLTGNEFSADTTVLQPKLTAGDGVKISAQNVISADIDPADFFTASETVDGTGSEMTLNNTIQAKIKSVQMYGDTYQQTYSGYQLLPTPYASGDTRTHRGITYVVNPDGTITMNGQNDGTASSAYYFVDRYGSMPLFELEAGTYYFIPNNADVRYEMYDGTNYYSFNSSNNYTVTFANSVSIRQIYTVVIRTNTTNYDNYKLYPMLTKLQNPTTADYEPYTGGIPAPSPSYPMPISVVTGEQTVTVTGKNLLDITTFENGYINSSGTVSGGGGTNAVFGFMPVLPETDYTVSVRNNSFAMAIAYYDSNKTLISRVTNDYVARTSRTFTTPQNCAYARAGFYAGSGAGQSVMESSLPQFEKGSSASSYYPYQGQQSYPIDLGATELCKIGDYQDYIYKSGDDWYLHKETGYTDLATQTWGGASSQLKPTTTITDVKYVTSNQEVGAGLAEKYIMRKASGMSTAVGYIAIDTSAVRVNTGDASITPTGLFYYALATPTDTKITDATLISELDALADALGYKDKTIITVSATETNLPAILEVSAYRNSLAGVLGVIGRAEAA